MIFGVCGIVHIVWLFVPFHVFFGVCGIVHLSVQRRAPAVTGFSSAADASHCSAVSRTGPNPHFHPMFSQSCVILLLLLVHPINCLVPFQSN